MVIPGSTIGIVGGGQLAKMICVAAANLGYKTHIYCPDKGSPAFQVTTEYTMCSYTDKKGLAAFAAKCDVITYEFENIPKETIEYLEQYSPVRPNSHVLETSQNRMKEKTFVNGVGVPTTKFEPVHSAEMLKSAIGKLGYPAILKSNTMGYDGKGQITIKSAESDLDAIWQKMAKMSNNDAILEAFVDFSCEVSVIVARNFDGKSVAFPVVENQHENHILRETIAPANVSDSIKKQAEDAALKIADGIGLVGVLAIEMFVTKDDKILVNELAPRPHNSGHWSIEGCATSQFEQVVRSICGLPLGNMKILAKKVVMRNLLGFEINEWKDYLTKENTHVHNYGKSEAREGRKMGHVTTLYY